MIFTKILQSLSRQKADKGRTLKYYIAYDYNDKKSDIPPHRKK